MPSAEDSLLTVGFVNFSRHWGGVRTWTLDFGKALQDRGHRIVAMVRPGTPFEARCRSAGFAVHSFRPGAKFSPLAVRRAATLLRRERVDVVVVNIGKDLTVGAAAAKILRLPVVHRVGLVEDYDGSVFERLRHRLLIDDVLVPALWMKERLLRGLPWLKAEEVCAIPNSKDLSRDTIEKFGRGGPLFLGVTSQLSPSKGHPYLFRVLEKLEDRGIRARLRIAGTGPLAEELRREAASKGLAERVEFAGFVDDVRGFLSSLDVFVLPSLKEGFPNSLLEAMAEGLPVVGFDLDGVREMAEGAGLLVPTGDAEGLAAAIASLAEDPRLRSELGKAARRRVEERYDVRRNAAQMETFLHKTVRRAASPVFPFHGGGRRGRSCIGS